MRVLNTARMTATVVVLLVFLVMAAVSFASIESPTYWFPAFVATAGIISACYSLVTDLRKTRRGESSLDGEVTDLGASVTDADGERPDDSPERDESPTIRMRVLIWAAWLVALPALSLFVPFFYASLIWLVAVLRFSGRKSWLHTGLSVVIFAVVLNVLVVLLDIRMPPAILTGWG